MSTEYGSATVENSTSNPKFQSFSISEPSYAQLRDNVEWNNNHNQSPRAPLRQVGSSKGSSWLSCCGSGNQMEQGLKLIIISMFVFAGGVTVALLIQIAGGVEPGPHDADQTASDHTSCTQIADQIMKEGGNAVDAAVAASFCLSVVHPHVSGIGGGGMMLIHKHRENKTVVIDFRETAPESASNEKITENPNITLFGKTSIGVPGFVKGMSLALEKYGSGHYCCEWGKLIYKSVGLASEIMASDYLVNATESKLSEKEKMSKTASNLWTMVSQNGVPISQDTMLYDIPIYNKMVQTLKKLALQGSESFYTGEISKNILKELDGILTPTDLNSYNAIERNPDSTKIDDFQIFTSPAPSSGPKLLAFMNAMSEYTKNQLNGLPKFDMSYYMQISKILSKAEDLQRDLGDPTNNTNVRDKTAAMISPDMAKRLLSDIEGETLGFDEPNHQLEPVSSNVAVMDKNDMYVSVVASLNTWFGSKFMTSDGILFNNAMSSFAIPSGDQFTTENTMSTQKRPLYNGLVALAVNTEKICGQRLILGGSTADSVGEVLADTILFKQDFKTSVDLGRLLMVKDTMVVETAFQGFDPKVLNQFGQSGIPFTPAEIPYTTVNGVDKTSDTVLPYEDIRSGGHVNLESHTSSRLQ